MDVFIVVSSMSSLKVALMAVFIATPVSPLDGLVELMVGRVVSDALAVNVYVSVYESEVL